MYIPELKPDGEKIHGRPFIFQIDFIEVIMSIHLENENKIKNE